MSAPSFEYNSQKQPPTIELFLKKVEGMNPSTLISYHQRWTRLLAQQSSGTLPEKMQRIVDSIIQRGQSNTEIRASTYRVYKASTIYGIAFVYVALRSNLIKDEDLEAGLSYQFLSVLYQHLASTYLPRVSSKNQPPRTSSHKKKYLPKEFYDFLVEKVASDCKKNPRFYLTWYFVEANLIVGLRPIEWLNATVASNIEHKCLTLFVNNAKNSYGRANGDVRQLLLLEATPEQQASILRFFVSFQMRLAKKAQACQLRINAHRAAEINKPQPTSDVLNQLIPTYEASHIPYMPTSEIVDAYGMPQAGLTKRVLHSMQDEMYRLFNEFLRTTKSDFNGYRVSLYSTRHQAVANAKAAKLSVFEIAGFFGHASIATNSRHYGKAWNGWSKFSFMPSLDSIRAVRDSEQYFSSEFSPAPTQAPSFTPATPDDSIGINL